MGETFLYIIFPFLPIIQKICFRNCPLIGFNADPTFFFNADPDADPDLDPDPGF